MDEGTGGNEDARLLLQSALHLGVQVCVEALEGTIAWPNVGLREASSEVNQCLHRHLREERNACQNLLFCTHSPHHRGAHRSRAVWRRPSPPDTATSRPCSLQLKLCSKNIALSSSTYLSSLWTNRSSPSMVGRKSSTMTSTQEPYCQNLKWKMPAYCFLSNPYI